MTQRKLILPVNGGCGKSIAATAVCEAIKKRYPDDELIVLTPYTDVFDNNPFVDRCYNPNTTRYFYTENIKGRDYLPLTQEPYCDPAFVKQDGHLIKVWCEMLGVPYNGEMPKIYLTAKEMKENATLFRAPKPALILQSSGGLPNQTDKYSWPRDMPPGTAQKVVNALMGRYTIFHIRRADQLPLQNTIAPNAPLRALFVLFMMSEKRLLIDSFAQHACAALGLPASVLWIVNQPSQFGYELHNNITANPYSLKPDLAQALWTPFNIASPANVFPYKSEDEVVSADTLVEAVAGKGKQAEEVAKKSAEQVHVRERIVIGARNNNMVAHRMGMLPANTDLSGVSRILDVGSWHLGQSIDLATIFPNARVDAFEPVPASYKLCKERHAGLDETMKKRIKVHQLALSNKEALVKFYAVEPGANKKIDPGFSSMFQFNEGLRNSYYADDTLLQKEIKVQATTLDNWCRKNKVNAIDILWIDAQGSELLVFQGAKQILKNTKIIMAEVGLKPYYKGHTLKPDIDKFLISLGFRELENAFELNGFDFEANTIYMKN